MKAYDLKQIQELALTVNLWAYPENTVSPLHMHGFAADQRFEHLTENKVGARKDYKIHTNQQNY